MAAILRSETPSLRLDRPQLSKTAFGWSGIGGGGTKSRISDISRLDCLTGSLPFTNVTFDCPESVFECCAVVLSAYSSGCGTRQSMRDSTISMLCVSLSSDAEVITFLLLDMPIDPRASFLVGGTGGLSS
jgi:hypothetical protein